MTTPTSGTDIVGLGISVDISEAEKAAPILDKLGTATVNVVNKLDNLTEATVKNSKSTADNAKWATESQRKYQEKIAAIEASIKAEQNAAAVQQKILESTSNFIVKLQQLNDTYGLTREQVYRLTAEQLNAGPVAEKLISQLEALRAATARYGSGITDLASIEEKERSAAIALNAQRIRSINEAAAAEESARIALSAQRNRSIAENKAAEESSITSLQAFKRRTLAENRAQAVVEIEAMDAANLAAIEKEKSRQAVFQAFKKRTLAENRAEAIRILNEQQESAVKLAEKQAIEEIKWAQMSVKSRIAELERLKAYQSNSAIRSETTSNLFSSAALKDLPNLEKYQAEVAKLPALHRSAHSSVNSLSEGFRNLGSNARTSTEILVLAHEAVQGRYNRMPASMMVLAEYMGVARLAFSAAGAAVLGFGAALAVAGYGVVKGIIEQKAMSDALIYTGKYAGLTTEALRDLAKTAASSSGGIGAAKEAVTALASSGRFTSETFLTVTKAVVGWEYATGRAVKDIVKEFESLAVQATGHTKRAAEQISINLLKLNDQYHTVTAAVYSQVRALEQEGRQREASELAIAAHAKGLEKYRAESVANLGFVERKWKDITHAIGNAKDAILSLGRTTGPAEEVARLTAEKARLESNISRWSSDPISNIFGSNDKEKLLKITQDLGSAQSKLAAANKAAREESEKAIREADGMHAMQSVTLQKSEMQRKSMGELNWALKEYAERVSLMKAADPGNLLVTDQEVAAHIAAIKRVHTSTVKGEDDRAVQLATSVAKIKNSISSVSEAYQQQYQIVSQHNSLGVISDQDAYDSKMRILKLEEESKLKLLTQQLELVKNFNAKTKVESTRNLAAVQEIESEISKTIISEAAKRGNLFVEEEERKKKAFENTIQTIIKDGSKEVESLEKRIEAQRKYNSEIGKTAEEQQLARQTIADIETQQLEADALYLENLLKIEDAEQVLTDKGILAYQARLLWLQMEIDKRKELSALFQAGAVLEADAAAAKKAAAEWERTANVIEKDLENAILDGGGNGMKKLASDMKKYFARLVLQPILQPASGAISSFMNPSAPQSADGIGGLFQTGQNIFNLGSKAANWLGFGSSGSAGSSMFAGEAAGFNFATAGAEGLAGIGASSALGGAGSMFAGEAMGFGYATGAGAGAAGAAGAGAGAAGGLTSMASLGPYVLAAMAIASIVKNTKGETRGGGQYGYSFDGVAQNNRRPGMSVNAAPGSVAFLEGPSGGEIGGSEVRTAIAATVQGINATLKSLGSAASLTGFQAALETSGKGRGGVFAGGMLNTGVRFGESGSGDNYNGTLFEKTSSQSPDGKTVLANFALDLKQATIQALQAATDLPKSIAEQLRGIDAEGLADDAASKLITTINAQIVAVTEFRDAIATLPLAGLRDLSFDTAAALLKFTGGLQGIGSQLAAFDKNFYSEAERATKQSEAVGKKMSELGFSSVDTKEKFRSLVEGFKVTDEATAQVFASLLSVSDAFAQVSDRAQAAAKDAQAAAEAQAQIDARAAADAAQAAADAAQANRDMLVANANNSFSALQRAVDAQKKTLQNAYNEQSKLLQGQSQIATSSLQSIQSVFNALSSSLTTLVPLSRSAAQGILSSALNSSNAGSSLKDFPQLNEALQAIAKPSEDLFVSFEDWQRDQKLTANTVSKLKDNAGAQVSVAQLTLDAINDTIKVLDTNHAEDISNLDRTIELAQSQINAINGVDDSVVSVQAALTDLANAILEARKVTNPGATSGVGKSVSPDVQAQNLKTNIDKYAKDNPKDSYYFIPGVNDFNAKMENARKLSKQLGAYDAAKFGTPELALLNSTGHDMSYWQDMQNQFDAGLRPRASFAVGINNVPFDMDARIHKDERVFPAADNRELMSRLAKPSETSELVSEMKALRKENAETKLMFETHLYAIAKSAKLTSDSLDDVILGGRSIKTTAA